MINFLQSLFYNHDTLILYFGGVFSSLFLAYFAYDRQDDKRKLAKAKLVGRREGNGEDVSERVINDILDNQPLSQKADYFQELIIWGIQPLFIIIIINLCGTTSLLERVVLVPLLIFTLFHEKKFKDKYPNNGYYRLLFFFLWVSSYILITYKTNQREGKIPNDKTQTEQCKSMASPANNSNIGKDSAIKRPQQQQ